MSFTPYNAPLLSGLLGDREVAGHFSIDSELQAIIRFEGALAKAQVRSGFLEGVEETKIASSLESFRPDLAALSKATVRDGLAIPELVRQMREHLGDELADRLHVGTTSQDAIDTALMLRLKNVFAIFTDRLASLIGLFDQTSSSKGGICIMARTRMQDALPITMDHKLSMWRDPLARLLRSVPVDFPLQLGGPEGALSGMGEEPEKIAAALAQELELAAPPVHWQTDRWPLHLFCSWACELTTALGKVGADVAIMSQNAIAEVSFKNAGTSSAMPHKNNPVLAESLVTLARFNAVQLGGLHQAALHENERSGSAWALEWMLVPQIMVATGAALRNCRTLIEQMEFPEPQ